jgi:pyruvate/2-oxoglutarate dehydrogenase complex dihydrolipoamide dehydrogenase (E3) component
MKSSIKEFYPDKTVTLIHSRDRFLPLFDKGIHEETVKRFEELGVEYILNDRVLLSGPPESSGTATLRTKAGRTITSDLRVRPTSH